MAEMRPTPGPWKAQRTNWRGEPSPYDIYVAGDEHECYEDEEDGDEVFPPPLVAVGVAIVCGNATSGGVSEANARLICAAPIGRDLAQAVLACSEPIPHRLRQLAQEFMSQAGAAVARAKGTETEPPP